jgi:hypothetical protein
MEPSTSKGHHDPKHLEGEIKALGQGLDNLADGTDFEELLKIIHRPGWTTPAEALLVSGLVDFMATQVKALTALKQVLLAGSRVVGTK